MQANDLLLLHLAATWALVGLIWTVQLVQYPGFAWVGRPEFRAFHEQHSVRITWVVAPLMGCELLTGLALLARPPALLSTGLLWAGLGLIALNWLWTAFVAMPLHRRLSLGRDDAKSWLVRTNWVRTVSWTLRGAWALVPLRAALASA